MTVEDVYRYQADLTRIARWHSPDDPEAAADALQTFYLKLCEIQQREGNLDRLFYNGKLNMVYVFTSLKNILIDTYRAGQRFDPLPDNYDAPDGAVEDELTTEEMCAEVRRELSEMREYDRLMTYAYYDGDHSIRSLAKAVNISPKNVFITLRRVRTKISESIIKNPSKFPKL